MSSGGKDTKDGSLNKEWKNRDVISINDFSKEDLESLFDRTDSFLRSMPGKLLDGKIVVNLFLEPSTRTRTSFQVAAMRLGAGVVNIGEHSSLDKGESFYDTFKMIDGYHPDMLVMRVKLEGAPRFAAEVCNIPVISGGEGTINHPTQAMIDLYSIREHFGRFDGLKIGVLGDLRYGRAAVSFILGMSKYSNNKITLISSEQLRLRPEIRKMVKSADIREESLIGDAINELDILYVTRIQKERFIDPAEYETVKNSYSIEKRMIEDSGRNQNLMIMHALPRTTELNYDVDSMPSASYFKQASFGVPIRMALMSLIMGVDY